MKRKISYFYDPEISNYYYGHNHAMKPQRITMTYALLSEYSLLHHMQVFNPTEYLCKFHEEDYVKFLRSVAPETKHDHLTWIKGFNVGKDCPVFNGLYCCQLRTTAFFKYVFVT
ncbi:hypothetical protein WN944_004051 [Citrus x changshan-huyou]|uniref:Histone deacetylase domain-containing protein n=1 Tax=Citrus x changshan-huyou TaxID=2935761 RepID=A0AAP0M4D4_9ROSI